MLAVYDRRAGDGWPQLRWFRRGKKEGVSQQRAGILREDCLSSHKVEFSLKIQTK